MGEAKKQDSLASLLQKQRRESVIMVSKLLYASPKEVTEYNQPDQLVYMQLRSWNEIIPIWPCSQGDWWLFWQEHLRVSTDLHTTHLRVWFRWDLTVAGSHGGEYDRQSAICQAGPCPVSQHLSQHTTLQPLVASLWLLVFIILTAVQNLTIQYEPCSSGSGSVWYTQLWYS